MTQTRAGAVALLLMSVAVPFFFPTFQLRLATLSLIWCIVLLGLCILMGQTGLISLGQAAFVGVGAYASALLSVKAGVSFWISMPLGGLVSSVTAVLIGLPTLKLKGHYLAIASLGFGEIVHQLFNNLRFITNGPDGVAGIQRPAFFGLSFGSPIAVYYLTLACAVILGGFAILLSRSTLGLALRAIKQDELAAESNGLNVAYYKLLAFTIAAFFAGVGGAVFAHFEGFISPDAFSTPQSVVLLTMLIIGGSRTVVGSLIGAALVTFLPEYLRFLGNAYLIVYGIIVLASILFAPDGVEGILQTLQRRLGVSKARKHVVSS